MHSSKDKDKYGLIDKRGPEMNKHKWRGKVIGIALIVTFIAATFSGTPVFLSKVEASPGTEIWDWYDLDAIRDNPNDSYVLMADLDSTTAGYTELASDAANEAKGWQPIGTYSTTFTGVFNGQGYEIRDLRVNRPYELNVGLFGCLDEGGVIKNVGMVEAIVTGLAWVGGLAGENYGTVSTCYSTGSVTALNCSAGGLVGSNLGTVNNCYSTSSVTGEPGAIIVGGLVGSNLGTVNNCYSTGSVTTVNHSTGGLVGHNDEGIVTNSFWDIETSGQDTSDGGTGKTATEMMDIATFTDTATEGLDEPWNIVAVAPGETNPSYIWNIIDGQTYPFLGFDLEQLTEDYFPVLYYHEDEEYFPTDFFHDDEDITNNHDDYNPDTWPKVAYVHTVEGSDEWEGYLVIQYWFYYAGDFKQPPHEDKNHDHDWESIFVFLKKDEAEYSPRYVAFFGHGDEWAFPWDRPDDHIGRHYLTDKNQREGTHTGVLVALGTHATYPTINDMQGRTGEVAIGYPPFDYAWGLGKYYDDEVGIPKSLETPYRPCGEILRFSDFDEVRHVEETVPGDWPDTWGTIPWEPGEQFEAPWIRERWREPWYLLNEVHRHYLRLDSPVDVLITDPDGRRVGFDCATGSAVNEIAGATYSGQGSEPQIVMIPDAFDGDYEVQLVGRAAGDYDMTTELLSIDAASTFTAIDIPVIENAVHRYLFDYDALARGEEGTTISVDNDGDGVFEKSFTAGSELTGDEFTQKMQSMCFIATAAYGTPMAEELQILRDFRDQYLLTNPLGQALVNLYYKVSPPVAEFITEHPNLKPIVRAGLLPAVVMSTLVVNVGPTVKVAMLILLVLVSVVVAVWVIRRRGRGSEYT